MRVKKIIAMMALGACVASYSASAFAATTDTTTETASAAATADTDGKGGRGRGDGQGRDMTDRYAALLASGTISQTTYDAITAYLAANMPERPDHADGTAPVDGSTDDSNRPERKDFLADLVTAGTLSQTSYDAINTYREAKRAEMEANAPADRTTDAAVTSDSSASTDAAGAPDGKGRGNGQGRGGDDTQWSDMVTAGIITQDECTAITAAMEAARPADADGSAPTDGTAPADGKNGTDGNHIRMEDTLLSAGIITQDEYTAITAAMESMKPADAQ